MAIEEEEEPEREVIMWPSGEALRPPGNETLLIQFLMVLTKLMYHCHSIFTNFLLTGKLPKGGK